MRSEPQIRLEGPVTIHTVGGLQARVGDIASRYPAGEVIVDCEAVSEADSAALALFLLWLRLAGHRLKIRNVPAGLMSLAGLYDLQDILPLAA